MGGNSSYPMSRIRKLFNVSLLVLQNQSKTDEGTSKEIWSLLLMVTLKLAKVRTPINPSKYFTLPPSKARIDPIPQSPKRQDDCKFDLLPTELMLLVVEHIDSQETLFKLSLVNKRCNSLISPLLMAKPYLTSPKSISSFLSSISNGMGQHITQVTFGPSMVGSLAAREKPRTDFEFIPYVHSGLFRLLIQERQSPIFTDNLVHPVFYEIAKCLPNCKSVEEHGNHRENLTTDSQNPQLDIFRRPRQIRTVRNSANREIEISKIPSSSATLLFLMRACQKWYKDFPEWNGIKDSVSDCLSACILLLDLYQGNFHPIWHQLGSDVVRATKPMITRQARHFLSHIYSTLLLQVRFVTSNSQRLLDCYCLIYYRVLSLAQNLDVQALASAMGCPATVDSRDDVAVSESRMVMLQEAQRHMENESFLSLTDYLPPNDIVEVVSNETLNSTSTASPQNPYFPSNMSLEAPQGSNMKSARMIYEALIVIFHFRIPANLHSSQSYPPVPVDLLRDILITFPPSTINSETVELISKLVNVKLDPIEASTPVLKEWLNWLNEIIRWHDASKEMEPVKDLLRKSMVKIDELRGLQVLPINVATIWNSLYGLKIYS